MRGTCADLRHTRANVCCSPRFQGRKADCERQRNAASFDLLNGLPHKEDALVEVDAVVMSGEDGSTCDHGETELLTISSVTVTLYTVEGMTHSQRYNADEPLGPLFELHCTQEQMLVAETLFHVDGHPVHMDETPRSLCVGRLHPVCIQVTSRLESVRNRLTEALSQVFGAETSLRNSLAQCLGR